MRVQDLWTVFVPMFQQLHRVLAENGNFVLHVSLGRDPWYRLGLRAIGESVRSVAHGYETLQFIPLNFNDTRLDTEVRRVIEILRPFLLKALDYSGFRLADDFLVHQPPHLRPPEYWTLFPSWIGRFHFAQPGVFNWIVMADKSASEKVKPLNPAYWRKIWALCADDSQTRYLRRAKVMPPFRGFEFGYSGALIAVLVKMFSRPGEKVLDPFAGSNVTGYVAERLGRCWITFELNESSFKASQHRFSFP